jgi:ABC-type polysaccharide/polyol phosphate export permease
LILVDDDILAGIRAWRLWTTWAWVDMIQRYRRSVIGPFWTTISMGLTISGMGLVFSTLFGQKISEFLPYLAAGMITWQLIQMTLTEGCTIFLLNDRMIRQFNLPLSIYAQRHVAKQFIIYAHHLVIFVLVALVFGIQVNFWTFLIPIGLALIFATGIAVSLLIGTLCARFRDIPPIVTNIVQLAFFVTPVMWKAELLGDKMFIAQLNPLFHFIEVVRRPLLGAPPTLVNYLVVVGSMVLAGFIALLFFHRFRHRVAFWL